ncbi:MAG: response regulator [Phycisphaerales bacterium]
MTTPQATTTARALILNVDDHQAARYAKTRILESAGYEVLEADTGAKALRLSRDRKPCIALIDVKLPDMSGLEVCRQIKSNPELSSILVIQNSASFVAPEDKVRGLEGGADTYLTAPIEPAVLIATVAAMLRLAQAEQALRAKEERLKELVQSERAAKQRAERADRLKDEFVTTLSHELRNPLTAITGWVSMLRSSRPDAQTLAQGLDVIERGCTAQRKLIEDILDISRIISGKLSLDVQEVHLDAVAQAVVSSLQMAANAKDIRLEFAKPKVPCRIYGDAARLQQILWNLLSNAIKFTPSRGTIHLELRSGDDRTQIRVTDSGVGIEPEFLPHVFERFRQADSSTTRRFGGLGLGLSIVKSLVELHGGEISVTSPGKGQGSTFVVDLPRGRLPALRSEPRPASPSPFEQEPAEPAPSTSNARVEGARVLILEDNADAADLIARVFTSAGAEVLVASSVQEAILLLGEFRADIVLSDVGMPEEDGFGFIRRVRAMGTASGEHLLVVALTAMARPEDRTLLLASGFDLHVAKPVIPSELVAQVAVLLANRHRA